MSDAGLHLHGVHKRHPNGLLALQDVTLDVAPGEFVALLGPSGCGKSTVLRLAAGLEAASDGRVDTPATRADPRAQAGAAETAFVFQEPTLMPWACCFDNVWLPLRLAGRSRAQAEPDVMRELRAVGLGDFAGAYPHELSGGMRMRASIARALVTRPRVLLMDEPFAALDEFTRQKLNADLLAWWAAHRLTVLFVTHSVYEAVFLSQRVLVMSGRPGRIVAEHRVPEPAARDAAWRNGADYVRACAAVSAAVEAAHGTQEAAP
ncbi:ABC transporter ATP-binding protein [Piscinibacter sakaiensis]|uniref:ABC-type nitrate/sulfonate/bicarbonate transport system, ATPase component n=1 Tax=Piscinibacter sakaiensis TaxID=1547922 RepID=A0A0K8NZI0_PISS1|nr:ABC transporter ATP-binding protein [Piscinibacter sakaiensis]GAP35812.1 ABC-type nitrate/sulfonate/bicarbonate transport system, ATPase component [Piscinibacter sakaiensis]